MLCNMGRREGIRACLLNPFIQPLAQSISRCELSANFFIIFFGSFSDWELLAALASPVFLFVVVFIGFLWVKVIGFSPYL